jgi:prolipoprotein diacylglyceryltransferase
MSFRCARYLVKDDRVYPFAFAVIIGGLAGARVAHIIDNPGFYGGGGGGGGRNRY